MTTPKRRGNTVTRRHLTPANQRVFDSLVRITNEQGRPPSLTELAEASGKGISTARYHLHELDKKGFVRVTPDVDRGIEILVESA